MVPTIPMPAHNIPKQKQFFSSFRTPMLNIGDFHATYRGQVKGEHRTMKTMRAALFLLLALALPAQAFNLALHDAPTEVYFSPRGGAQDAIVQRIGAAAQALAAAGCTVWLDRQHAIAHNKIMVFDGRSTATGSFNFTASAEERNAENLLLIDSPDLARLYLDEWERHRAHAERF